MVAAPIQIVVATGGAPCRRETAHQARRARRGDAHTEGAALHIGGLYVDGEVKGAIRSRTCSRCSPTTPARTVRGLETVPCRPAAGERGTHVVPGHGRDRVAFLALAAWIGVRAETAARSDVTLVPARRRGRRAGRRARVGLRLGRDRGRPSAVDRRTEVMRHRDAVSDIVGTAVRLHAADRGLRVDPPYVRCAAASPALSRSPRTPS